MFRVPADADSPTFDHTFPVSFGRWLTSSAAERREWVRRRNAAARLAASNQRQRVAAHMERVTQPRPARTPAAAPGSAYRTVDGAARTRNRLARVQLWIASLELAAHLVMALVVLAALAAVCGGIGWVAFGR